MHGAYHSCNRPALPCPLGPTGPKLQRKPSLAFFHVKTRDLPISKERATGVSETKLKEVTQHADGKGIYNQPRGQAWNAWQTLPGSRRRRRQHSRVSTV